MEDYLLKFNPIGGIPQIRGNLLFRWSLTWYGTALDTADAPMQQYQ